MQSVARENFIMRFERESARCFVGMMLGIWMVGTGSVILAHVSKQGARVGALAAIVLGSRIGFPWVIRFGRLIIALDAATSIVKRVEGIYMQMNGPGTLGAG